MKENVGRKKWFQFVVPLITIWVLADSVLTLARKVANEGVAKAIMVTMREMIFMVDLLLLLVVNRLARLLC